MLGSTAMRPHFAGFESSGSATKVGPDARPWWEAPGREPAAVRRVEQAVREGRAAEVLLTAYPEAEDDVRRAFGMDLRTPSTHREFLSRHLRPDMGLVAVLLPQLYELYEPVRYGTSREVSGERLVELVRGLYHEPAMRRVADRPGGTAWPNGPPGVPGAAHPERPGG